MLDFFNKLREGFRLLCHKLCIEFFHLVRIADNAEVIRRRHKADFGNTHGEEILTLAEMKSIVSAQGHGSYMLSVLNCFYIEPVNEFIARINKLDLLLARIFIFAVNVAPLLATHMLKREVGNALKVASPAVPKVAVHCKPA